MRSTAVVHLVWGPLGVQPLRAFLRSYHAHEAGLPHELVVVFNGVSRGRDARPDHTPPPAYGRSSSAAAVPDRETFLAELRDTPHRLIELEQPVQDLPAYALAARQLEHGRLCFLNSYSTILAPGWLAKLSDGLSQPGTGIVAATGSWASFSSWVMYTLLLPSAYHQVLPGRREAKRQFLAIGAEREGIPPRRRSVLDRLRELPAIPEQLIRFKTFPAPHLRTNGFMVERELMQSLRLDRITRKMGAYSQESGRNGITCRIQRRGLRALIVARNGELYGPEHWPQSHTFWQGDQEGLLIADNQTRFYANGPLERRRVLSTFAWGRQADPHHPTAFASS